MPREKKKRKKKKWEVEVRVRIVKRPHASREHEQQIDEHMVYEHVQPLLGNLGSRRKKKQNGYLAG